MFIRLLLVIEGDLLLSGSAAVFLLIFVPG